MIGFPLVELDISRTILKLGVFRFVTEKFFDEQLLDFHDRKNCDDLTVIGKQDVLALNRHLSDYPVVICAHSHPI